jgi:hypothetical protein
LNAFHVELSTPLGKALVQSNDFGAEEVFASREIREDDGVFTSVCNEVFNGPFAVAAEAFFCELDPDVSGAIGAGGGDVG